MSGCAPPHRRWAPQEADGRADAGIGRHDHARDAELLGEPRGMQRCGAAEGDQRVLADDVAALDRMHARGVGHVLAHDLVHAEGRRFGRQSQRLANVAQRAPALDGSRSSAIVPPANASGSILPSTRSASVTAGRCRRGRSRQAPARTPALSGPTLMRFRASTCAIEPPPAPISTISITGMRTGRPRPFMKRAARSTSKARGFGLVLVDQADLGGRAAHVEGQHPALAEARRDLRREDRAAGRPGFDQADRKAPRRLDEVRPPPEVIR